MLAIERMIKTVPTMESAMSMVMTSVAVSPKRIQYSQTGGRNESAAPLASLV